MNQYNPRRGPRPAAWLALDEQERIDLVQVYHRRGRVQHPSAMAHTIIHVIVENQIAMREAPAVRRVLHRLRTEGLSRHDAIHAIGNVLAVHLNAAVANSRDGIKPPEGSDLNQQYLADLELLTAKAWLDQTFRGV